MSKYKKLKPCPFCGGEARVGRDSFSGLFCVGCLNDECLGFSGLGWIYKKEEEAIEAWNKRSNECDREYILDQLDKMVDESKQTVGFCIGSGLTIERDGLPSSVTKGYAIRIREALGVMR
jgi:hypothetical protein